MKYAFPYKILSPKFEHKMTLSSEITIFDLPAELRIRIYELVFFHEETGGIISPLRNGPDWSTIAFVDGRRYNVRPSQIPVFETKEGEPPSTPEEKLKEDQLKEEYAQSSNGRSNHLCSSECLLQPSVSKVSRQLREETLALFYGTHQFHFEMSNFEVTDKQGLRVTGWSPTDWWRAIGDTNLRSINKLTLVCHPSSLRHAQMHTMVKFVQVGDDRALTIEEIPCWPVEKRPVPASIAFEKFPTIFEKYRYHKTDRSDDYETRIALHDETVRESGLHVQVLECVLSALEPCTAEYLRDHKSLDDDREMKLFAAGRGEKVFGYSRSRLMWNFECDS